MRIPESTLIVATFVAGILVTNYFAPKVQEPPAPAPCSVAVSPEN